MATTSVTIKYRPVRIGFLVEDGRTGDLVKAAGVNTLLWGGIHNPLIPVSPEKLEFAEQLLDLFSVDVLYPVAETEAISGLVEKHKFLRDPHHYADRIFYEDWGTKKQLVGYLDSYNIVSYYWERELKHRPTDRQSDCLLLRWDAEDALDAVFALQYGFFPTEYGLRDDYQQAFMKGLRSRELTIARDAPIGAEVAGRISPLALTRAELRGPRDPVLGDGVYLGDEGSFEDLLTFWNLRAAGGDLLFLPRRHLDRLQELAAAHLHGLDERPHSHPNLEDLLSLHHRTASDEELAALRARLPTRKGLLNSRCDGIVWNGLNIRPGGFHFDWEQAHATVDKTHGRYVVNIQLPEMKFLPDTERDLHGQQLVAEVSASGDFSHPGHVLEVPRIRQLNEFYSREIAVDPWALRVQRDGIARIIETRTGSLTLYPISHAALIRRVLEFAGMESEASQPGLLALKIIEKIDGIDGGRVFKIRGVRDLMQGLRPHDSVTRSEAKKRILAEGQFKQHEDLYIEARERGKLTTGQVFDHLLKHEFFRAGLELTCSECKLGSWLALREIDDVWVCEYCGSRNLTSLHLRHSGDWKFRKSGLFAKDNNQEGSLPVVLTLLVFLRILDMSGFVWTTALKLDPPNCEVDFCVLNYQERGRIEIGVGECKSRGGAIDQGDLEKLKAVREKLTAAGLECYITYAKTADEFTPDELALLTAAADEANPMILLTNREMEPYHPYWEDKSGVPEKYAHSLGEMARNSMERYLQKPYHPPMRMG